MALTTWVTSTVALEILMVPMTVHQTIHTPFLTAVATRAIIFIESANPNIGFNVLYRCRYGWLKYHRAKSQLRRSTSR